MWFSKIISWFLRMREMSNVSFDPLCGAKKTLDVCMVFCVNHVRRQGMQSHQCVDAKSTWMLFVSCFAGFLDRFGSVVSCKWVRSWDQRGSPSSCMIISSHHPSPLQLFPFYTLLTRVGIFIRKMRTRPVQNTKGFSQKKYSTNKSRAHFISILHFYSRLSMHTLET